MKQPKPEEFPQKEEVKSHFLDITQREKAHLIEFFDQPILDLLKTLNSSSDYYLGSNSNAANYYLQHPDIQNAFQFSEHEFTFFNQLRNEIERIFELPNAVDRGALLRRSIENYILQARKTITEREFTIRQFYLGKVIDEITSITYQALKGVHEDLQKAPTTPPYQIDKIYTEASNFTSARSVIDTFSSLINSILKGHEQAPLSQTNAGNFNPQFARTSPQNPQSSRVQRSLSQSGPLPNTSPHLVTP